MRKTLLAAMVALSACGRPEARDLSADPDRFSVRERRPFFAEAMRASEIAGHDGAASVPFEGGSLWLFGDTFLERGGGLTNSAFVARESGVVYLDDPDGRARHVLPLVSPETWEANRIWPGAGVTLGDSIYLYFERIVVDETMPGAPWTIGLARASVSDPELTFTRVSENVPLIMHSVVRHEGDLFLYGIRKLDDWTSVVELGRVAEEDIENPEAYETLESELVADVWGQVSVAYDPFSAKWVMLHVGNVFEEPRTLYLRTASDPRGPFSEPIRLATIPGETGEGWRGLLYCAYFHPELFRDRVLVFSFCVVGEGRPHIIEVELVQPL